MATVILTGRQNWSCHARVISENNLREKLWVWRFSFLWNVAIDIINNLKQYNNFCTNALTFMLHGRHNVCMQPYRLTVGQGTSFSVETIFCLSTTSTHTDRRCQVCSFTPLHFWFMMSPWLLFLIFSVSERVEAYRPTWHIMGHFGDAQARWLNQHCQSSEGSQLIAEIGFSSTRTTSLCYHWMHDQWSTRGL